MMCSCELEDYANDDRIQLVNTFSKIFLSVLSTECSCNAYTTLLQYTELLTHTEKNVLGHNKICF